MFNLQVIQNLAESHAQTFRLLKKLEDELNRRYYGSEESSRAIILALATGEPLLFIGPPGTAKSHMVRTACQLVGLVGADDNEPNPNYFEYLLSPFTEPSELFGYYDLQKLSNEKELIRRDQYSLQKATIVFLDEVFNSSSALMNSLLSVINEGIFHDRGLVTPVAMKCLFSATNSVPQSSELLAFYDRFLFRVRVDNAGEKVAPHLKVDGERMEMGQSVHKMIKAGWEITYRNSNPEALKDLGQLVQPGENRGLLEQLRKGISEQPLSALRINDAPDPRLIHIVSVARQRGLSKMSNRRVIKMVHAMLIHRLYRQTTKEGDLSKPLGKDDLSIAWRYCLDSYEDAGVSKMADMAWE